jgi:uncharacterized membrane protein YkgB
MCFAALALIHVAPAIATLRPSLIERLYQVDPQSAVFPLLHHRAVLFAIIVLLSIWSMFRAEARSVSVCAIALSMVSFLIIYLRAGRPRQLRHIAIADVIGMPFLALAAWATLQR